MFINFFFRFFNTLLFILFSRLKQIIKLSLLNNNIIHRGTGSHRSAHAQRRRGDSCAGRNRRSRAASLISMLECDVVVALVDEESPNQEKIIKKQNKKKIECHISIVHFLKKH